MSPVGWRRFNSSVQSQNSGVFQSQNALRCFSPCRRACRSCRVRFFGTGCSSGGLGVARQRAGMTAASARREIAVRELTWGLPWSAPEKRTASAIGLRCSSGRMVSPIRAAPERVSPSFCMRYAEGHDDEQVLIRRSCDGMALHSCGGTLLGADRSQELASFASVGSRAGPR